MNEGNLEGTEAKKELSHKRDTESMCMPREGMYGRRIKNKVGCDKS